jgi:carotenoid cleavage dioxygenase-like enzyme
MNATSDKSNIPNNLPFGPTDNVYLQGNFAPILTEEFHGNLEVEGEIPEELNGAVLIRVGPNAAYKPLDMKYHHWIDGAGMVNAFYIKDGKVDYRNRFVDTFKMKHERKANKALFGGSRSLSKTTFEGWKLLGINLLNLVVLEFRKILGKGPTDDLFYKIAPSMNDSNTNILLQNGYVLSFEEIGKPYLIKLDTLETIGEFTYHGELLRNNSAHPLTDPFNQYSYTNSYCPIPPYMKYYEITPDARISYEIDMDVPYPAMVHGFALSEKYYVHFHFPAVYKREYLGTHQPIRWEPENNDSFIGILKRHDPAAKTKWYKIPTTWVFHNMNAYDDGDKVQMFVAKFPRIPMFGLDTENPSPPFTEQPNSQFVQWTLELITGEFTEKIINPNLVEFPLMDPRFLTRKQKHGWYTSLVDDVQKYGLWNTVCHYDFENEREESYYAGKDFYVGEALFTPKYEDSPEGVGYIMCVRYNLLENRSDMIILDAQNVAAGPIATIKVPRRIEYDFHGSIIRSWDIKNS